MCRHRLLAVAAVAVFGVGIGGCSSTVAGVDGTLMVDTAIGTPGTTATAPPSTVDFADPLLRTLVGTEWEVVSLDGRVVAEILGPFVLRFWGDGKFTFTGGCPEGSHGTYEVDGMAVRFDSDVDAATPAIGCLSVDDLLQGRLMSVTDHGMDVSSFSDREILAATVFPKAFALVLRPTTSPVGAVPSS